MKRTRKRKKVEKEEILLKSVSVRRSTEFRFQNIFRFQKGYFCNFTLFICLDFILFVLNLI